MLLIGLFISVSGSVWTRVWHVELWLATSALRRYVPEFKFRNNVNCLLVKVLGVGGSSDVTPAADWWSLGAILHLLYCGVSPGAWLASGVDNSIPLQLSAKHPREVQQFISELLQPQPEMRLGAGSCGSHDVRSHPFFSGWNWEKMSWK